MLFFALCYTYDNIIFTTVSTSVSTELTSQNITSSVNSSNGISNDSQGHKDKHAVSEDDDTSDGIFGNTAMVAGIASAAGVLVLAPLLVFVLKSLCKATKVDPRPNG